MKALVLSGLLLSASCSAVEFDNSLGFGFQYGGLLGWQGSISNENLHGRLALGVVGVSLGGDVDVNKYVSVGVTAARIFIGDVEAFNLNYYFSGKYTEGWRIGLDVGSAKAELFKRDSDEGNFASISFGYSFK